MIFFNVQVTKQPLRQHVYETIPTKDCEEMPQHFSYQAMNCSQKKDFKYGKLSWGVQFF